MIFFSDDLLTNQNSNYSDTSILKKSLQTGVAFQIDQSNNKTPNKNQNFKVFELSCAGVLPTTHIVKMRNIRNGSVINICNDFWSAQGNFQQ